MALQWMVMAYVVAAEAGVALMVTMPSPNALRKPLVSAVSLILHPALFLLPFAAFHLLDIYWKSEHRLMCNSDAYTATERDRYHTSIYKSQRNAILCVLACLLYWSIYRICRYQKVIQVLEDVEKRYKAQ